MPQNILLFSSLPAHGAGKEEKQIWTQMIPLKVKFEVAHDKIKGTAQG
jgi:hypothetical protein